MEKNFLSHVILGFTLRDILTIIAITLSIISFIFNIFDIKTKISNFTMKNKIDKLSEKSFIYLLFALYIYKKKISRDIFVDNGYNTIVIDSSYIDNMKKRLEQYIKIYENSLLKNINLYYQYLEYKKIYELCNKYSDNKILDKLLYPSDYGYTLSEELINILESDIKKYLLKYHRKNINCRNILNYIKKA